jgi:UDP-glucose 4-epimerase
MNRWMIIGGAGFIGSHFTDTLLADPTTEKVLVYDNLSSGRAWHFEHHLNDPRFAFKEGFVEDRGQLEHYMYGHDTVIHLASNPDIAKAATYPAIDFYQGTELTHCVVDAARATGVKRLLYASGSGVYGDLGDIEAHEDYGPLLPISTYGASKLAGEALINSYCCMFGLTACMFRFANVVGGSGRATHGITLDFTKKLLANPKELTILGDGTQSKSYIDVNDVVSAVLTANKNQKEICRVYNVGTNDYITVAEIADLIVECLQLSDVEYKYTGGNRGWKGDVPIVRLNTDRIRSLGWTHTKTSRQALKDTVISLLPDILAGKM